MFYDVKPLIEYCKDIQSNFIVVVGGKGNGKTYSCLDYALREYLINNRVCRYLRRYKESILTKHLSCLMNPHASDLKTLTKGRYNSFVYKSNAFYLARREDNKITERDLNAFMICSALNSVESGTGTDFGECSCIIFDEFLSREREIIDEFYKLMIFHNNCTRNRNNYYIPTILLGNTVTRDSQLLKNFNIDLYNIEKNSVVTVKNKKNEVLCVCEYCDVTDKMAESSQIYYDRFNNSKINMITHAEFVQTDYAVTQSENVKDIIATIKCIYNDNNVLAFNFCLYKDRIIAYVSKFEDDETEVIATLINKNILFKDNNTFNYLPNLHIFKKMRELLINKQTYFENAYIAEIFRDFCKNFKNLTDIARIYT